MDHHSDDRDEERRLKEAGVNAIITASVLRNQPDRRVNKVVCPS
jgi:phosphohistidine phosphatase SixA